MIINTKQLLIALKSLKPIVPVRTNHPVLNCYYLKLSGDRLIVRASDLNNSAETTIDAFRGTESDRYATNSVCIPAFWGDENKRWFCDFIAQIGKDSGELTIDFEEELLKIKFDRADYQFNGIRGEEFIAFPEVGIPIATIKTNKTAFIEKFKAVLTCVSNDKHKQVLTGVHLLKQGTDLRFETCDGYSIAVDWLPSEIDGELDAIVNPEMIDAIAKFETDSENIEIEFYREVCKIQMGTLTLYSRLIEGTYPDITKLMIMPDRFVQFKPKDLVKQVRSVRGKAGKRNREPLYVWLSVGNGELVAEGCNGAGKISAKVSEGIDLTKAYARLDSDYLLPILSKLGKNGEIALSPNQLAVMRSDSGTYFALMPIRTINHQPAPMKDGIVVNSITWNDGEGNLIGYQKAEEIQYTYENNCLTVINSVKGDNRWYKAEDLPYKYEDNCLTVTSDLHKIYWQQVSPTLKRSVSVDVDFLMAVPLPAIAEVSASEPIAPPEVEPVPEQIAIANIETDDNFTPDRAEVKLNKPIATPKNKPLSTETKVKRLAAKKQRLERQIASSTNNGNIRKWGYELTLIEAKIEGLTPQPVANNDEIKTDIINLSSGVLASCCSQAGVKCTNYEKLDRVRDSWLNWLASQSKEFKRWQQCWIDFADEVSLTSIIESGEKIELYTSAPMDYDGFGTTTIAWLDIKSNRGERFRKIAVSPEHLDWQCSRYLSGLRRAYTPEEFEKLKSALLVPA